MKTRLGFVSNSSSSSFVLVKAGLSEETLNMFRDWVKSHNNEACEGYISERILTFLGDKDMHVEIPDDLWVKIENNVDYGDW